MNNPKNGEQGGINFSLHLQGLERFVIFFFLLVAIFDFFRVIFGGSLQSNAWSGLQGFLRLDQISGNLMEFVINRLVIFGLFLFYMKIGKLLCQFNDFVAWILRSVYLMGILGAILIGSSGKRDYFGKLELFLVILFVMFVVWIALYTLKWARNIDEGRFVDKSTEGYRDDVVQDGLTREDATQEGFIQKELAPNNNKKTKNKDLWHLISKYVEVLFWLGIIVILGVRRIDFLYSMVVLLAVFVGIINYFFIKFTNKEAKSRPENVDLVGLKVDNLDSDQAICKIDGIIEHSKSKKESELNLIVTPYSEYYIKASREDDFKEVLNNARLSLPDGIFVLWAASFSKMILKVRNKPVRFLLLMFQYVFSGAAIVLYPEFTRRIIKERVSGSELIFPLMKLASKKEYKVFFLGGRDWGRGNAGLLAAKKFREMYPNLHIIEVYPGERQKETRKEAIKLINEKKPDILVVCFGGGSGETWMYKNRKKINAHVGIGLGGTFDFVAGYAGKIHPILGRLGLEWFLRPISKERGSLIYNVRRTYRVWYGMIVSSIIMIRKKLNFKERI